MCVCFLLGYGFVDFDSPAAAQKAVASLKANGVQAQMAKVRAMNAIYFSLPTFLPHVFMVLFELCNKNVKGRSLLFFFF